jgi:hypothetical protein
MEINIKKIVVLKTSDGTDHVFVHTQSLLPPIPKLDSRPLVLSFITEKNHGVEYVRKVFGVEPEVIESQR